MYNGMGAALLHNHSTIFVRGNHRLSEILAVTKSDRALCDFSHVILVY